MLDLKHNPLIIDTAWINNAAATPVDGCSFAVENPANGDILAYVADSGVVQAKDAVTAAAEALKGWKQLLAKERSAHLQKWLTLIKENSEELARLISLEQGKPHAESRNEVSYSCSYIEWYAEEAKRSYGEVIPEESSGRKLIVVREPIGVVAAITPWNFPFAMLARKIAPALAAGCTLVAKPSEDAPLTALAIARLATEAGMPAGVINIVPASRQNAAEVGSVWLRDFRVRKLSFTGSTAVGKMLAAECAGTLKRLSLELGGNAPFIVFNDANLDRAVDGVMAAKFRNAGQTCVCANRILVQNEIYDRFAELLAERVAGLRVGPAEESDSEIGPLINEKALDKVIHHIQDAINHGAKVTIGGSRHFRGRYFFQPTVLTEVTAAMVIAREETFGPVAPLFRFGTEDEAIEMANDTPTGLAGYFYSNDMQRIWRVAAALETGIVGVNEGIISTAVAPFGGVKESGYGREGSRFGMEEYQQLKYICMGGLE